MTPQQWQRAKELFAAALEREPGQRADFLDAACGDDAVLRAEIESLLASYDQAGSFIASPAVEDAAHLIAERQSPVAAGRQIGHYQIISLLGQGGMGEVYLAADTRLGRRVALKLLRSDLTVDADRVRRFEREAQAVSALNHPNILTIHEVGREEGVSFIATEFVQGETLRERLATGRLELSEALEVAEQIAAALSAAHAAGIIHRDIKPENVMRRSDGYVKVLDFGLAKLTEAAPRGGQTLSELATQGSLETAPGLVLGTLPYMSPEQLRGQPVDARTDVWSLGVMLYEMAVGERPFSHTATVDQLAAILTAPPPPLSQSLSQNTPSAVQHAQQIIDKALAKGRAERYQTSGEMLAELRAARQELEFAARLERAQAVGRDSAQSGGRAVNEAATGSITSHPTTPLPGGFAANFIAQLKRRNSAAAVTLAALTLAAAVFFAPGLWPPKRAAALTEKDTVLLADFANATNEPVFDGALKQALAVQLEQSPFLNILSEARVRETLGFMGRPADERVTSLIAREICRRQNVKAWLAGSIASLGSHYVITLEAVNSQTGETLAREQAEAEAKERVLAALGAAAAGLREKLGESLRSVQSFDAPIEQATTSSLDALKAFTLGNQLRHADRLAESVPYFKQAVELDPNFALPYVMLSSVYENLGQPTLEAEYATQAYERRAQTSEREKFVISFRYHNSATRDLEQAVAVAQLWKQSYPRADVPLNLLAARYVRLGQFKKAVAESEASIRLNPNSTAPHINLGTALMRLGRFDEARRAFERVIAERPDSVIARRSLFLLAFARGDDAGVKAQIEWAQGQSAGREARRWQAEAALFAGQLRRARQLSAPAPGAPPSAADLKRFATLGGCGLSRESAAAPPPTRDALSLAEEAHALALCGNFSRAQTLIDEASRRSPHDTILQSVWLPVARAALELRRHNPPRVIQILEAVRPYEAAAQFWPAYLRGQAHLAEGAGAEAAAQFQYIIDHRGQEPTSPLYPLAHLGLARAARLTSDTAQSRASYQNFFTLWNEADEDLADLIAARREYEEIK